MDKRKTNHVRRVLNTIATKNFAQIFSTVNYSIWPAEWEGIEGVGKLCLD